MQDFQDGQTQSIGGVTYVRQGGQWHAQAAAIYGAPPKPDIPSGYQATGNGLAPIPGGPADPSHRVPDAPSGYRFHGSNLEPIPGGPADPNKDAPKVGVSPVTGPDYLKQLDSGTGAMVKALAEGRKSFPSGAALRSPYWQEMLTHVSNYDPGFDEVNYTSRSATRRDFTAGKAAQNIRALNTAIGHLGHLAEQVDGTASHGFVPLNVAENTAMRVFGDPGPTNYDATASALAGELTAVYRGSGGAEADIKRYIDQFSPNASEAQKLGTIRNIVGLLKSRLDALNDQYRQGMGTTAQQLQLLDPQAQLIVHHLGGFDAAGAPQDGSGPSAPPPGMGEPPQGGGTPPQGPAPQDHLTAATGSTKEVVDPSLTPVRREYMARLDQGQSGAQLVAFLNQAGVNDPAILRTAAEQAAFRRKNPNVPVSQYNTSAIDHLTEQMGGVNKALNAVGQSGVGAAALAAGNAVTGNYLPEIVGATGGNTEQARLAADYSAQDHPGAALAGGIVGGTTAALGGEAALARGGMAAGIGRTLAADAGYGAVAGSGASPDNRTEGAVLGGLAGAGGSLAGQAVARGIGGAVKGVVNRDVQALTDAGIPMTAGQAAGGKTKAAEDLMMSAVGGGSILKRRAEGYRVFNSKAFDKALEPIGGSVNGQTGGEAVAEAQQKVSDAFGSALKGKVAVPDNEFITATKGPMQRLAMNKRVGPEIVQEIEAQTQGLFDPQTGALSGENMQSFLESLRDLRKGYKNDALYSSLIKPSIQGIENAVEGMFKRQAPEVMPQYNAAKAAYRRLSILSDAVNNSNANEVFTPRQLRRADINNAKKYNGAINAASGETQFRDISGPASRILPSEVPTSGSAERLAALKAAGGVSALASGGAGLGYLGGDTKTGAESGLGLAGLLVALYSKTGQRGLVAALIKRPEAARAVGAELKRLAPIAGGAGTALTTSGQ